MAYAKSLGAGGSPSRSIGDAGAEAVSEVLMGKIVVVVVTVASAGAGPTDSMATEEGVGRGATSKGSCTAADGPEAGGPSALLAAPAVSEGVMVTVDTRPVTVVVNVVSLAGTATVGMAVVEGSGDGAGTANVSEVRLTSGAGRGVPASVIETVSTGGGTAAGWVRALTGAGAAAGVGGMGLFPPPQDRKSVV